MYMNRFWDIENYNGFDQICFKRVFGGKKSIKIGFITGKTHFFEFFDQSSVTQLLYLIQANHPDLHEYKTRLPTLM